MELLFIVIMLLPIVQLVTPKLPNLAGIMHDPSLAYIALGTLIQYLLYESSCFSFNKNSQYITSFERKW